MTDKNDITEIKDAVLKVNGQKSEMFGVYEPDVPKPT
jgi:hypothetical protein